ncbi:uncharacterized protein LOC6588544 [Drosophila persimilis]|uniref:uncharacterized protein LOC6588544 n=1 Tax=Drosophila persimilis TaxID=7234 RepID=UPI000F081680|nr:uncharacterized protein LOC6588544 [Drosophila persimilis]
MYMGRLHTPRHNGRIQPATMAGSSYSTRRRDATRSVGYWLSARTPCTGAPGTLIKTGQSRSLAKDLPYIPPATTDCPNVPLPVSGKNIRAQPRNITVHALLDRSRQPSGPSRWQ